MTPCRFGNIKTSTVDQIDSLCRHDEELNILDSIESQLILFKKKEKKKNLKRFVLSFFSSFFKPKPNQTKYKQVYASINTTFKNKYKRKRE